MNHIPLPVELLHEILTFLDLPDLKRIRLIDRNLNAIVTPLCFQTIRFDLIHKSECITSIASANLARHVRKLILRPTPLLREFDGFYTWNRTIALPGDPDVGPDEIVDCDGDDSLMSFEEWSSLSDDEKEALYNEYEADRKKEKDKVRNFTGRLCFRKLGCVRREQIHPKRTSTSTADEQLDKASALEQLDEAIKKFSNLAVFEHEPSFLINYELSSRWRRLRFNLDILVVETYCYEDEDVEALQLSILLRAIGWAQCKLRSINFYVGGPAFWGPDRLRRLWQGEGHGRTRTLRETFGNAEEADREAYVDDEELQGQRDRYSRQLAIMEYGMVNVTNISCSVSEEEENGGVFTTVRPFFEFLSCCEKLEQAHLVFGRLVDGGLRPGRELQSHGDGPGALLALLTEQTPWPKLRELELEVITNEHTLVSFLSSIAPTLRRLALSNVTLSQGTWESTVSRIASILQLDSLKLFNLCDYDVRQSEERKLFEQAKVWDCNDMQEVRHTQRVLFKSEKDD